MFQQVPYYFLLFIYFILQNQNVKTKQQLEHKHAASTSYPILNPDKRVYITCLPEMGVARLPSSP